MERQIHNYKKGKRKKLSKYLTFSLVLILIALTGKRIIKTSEPKLISPLPLESPKSSKNKEELLKEIRKLVEGKGTYSVFIYELNTKEKFGFGEEMIFTAASLNKIPILASLYFLVGKGDLDLDRKITLQKKDIQDYGTGSIRYDPPGTQYSLKTLARLLMEKSDNTAAYILSEIIITLPKIQELIESWGLTQTDMINNKTSNQDMALLLSLIYQGKITNQALTKEMLGFMDDSDFEDRLPKLLPPGLKVYHKIGNEIGIVHDVGIINFPPNPYYLGVLATDVPNEEEAKEIIAKISEMVFDFESKKLRNKGSFKMFGWPWQG